jgi:hypothetical protein
MNAAQAGPQHLEPLAPLDTVLATLHAGGKTSSIRFLADTGANITAIQLSDLGSLGMSLASLTMVYPLTPNDPSEWLHPMVVTRKKDPSKCRITMDLRQLNKATLSPVLPTLSPW